MVQDEAMIGLMALHTGRGEVPVYLLGQDYIGSLDAMITGGLYRLFGPSTTVLRLLPLFWYSLFQGIVFVLVRRWWSTRIALLTVLILALPHGQLLVHTGRSDAALGALGAFGLGLVVVSERTVPGRALLAGLFAGFGYWVHPMMTIVIAGVGAVWLLASPEWARLHGGIARAAGRWTAPILFGLATAFGLLGVFAFFSGGCPLPAARPLFGLACLALLAAILAVGGRRRIAEAASLAAGVVVGATPMLIGLWEGTPPGSNITPACPFDAPLRAIPVFDTLAATLAGLPRLSAIAAGGTNALWWIAFAGAVAAVIATLWSWRQDIAGLATMRPIADDRRAVALVILLLALPILLAVLGTGITDPPAVRYLFVAWVPFALVVAQAIDRLAAVRRPLALVAIGGWVVIVGLGNIALSLPSVEARSAWWPPEDIAAMERFLAEERVAGGYSEGYLAYVLNALTAERFIFAPYSGNQRYAAYPEAAARMPSWAFVFWPEDVPPSVTTIDGLVSHLRGSPRGGPIDASVAGALAESTLRTRRTIGQWDIWIVD